MAPDHRPAQHLVHVYDQLHLDQLWVAVEAVPQLVGQLEAILEELG